MRILIVEDEQNLADALAEILRQNHFLVDHAADGELGLDCALSGVYDIILLDIMLPKMNGMQVLKELRKTDKKTAVIMLTAKGEVVDKIDGLNHGADDYLPKPFNKDELVARIHAVSRRRGKKIEEPTEVVFDDITLDTKNLILYSKAGQIALTFKEAQLLEYFIHNSTMVLSKERIIDKIWGWDSDAEDNNVEVYISFLRKKLTHLKANAIILTIRGVGYKLCSKNSESSLL